MRLLFISLIFLFFAVAKSEAKSKFIKIKTTVKKEQSLDDLLTSFIKNTIKPKKIIILKKRTKKLNPQIKNWNKLKRGTRLTLILERDHLTNTKLRKLNIRRLKTRQRYMLSSSLGSLRISDEANKTLDINLAKLSLNYKRSLSRRDSYQVGLGTVAFFNLKYSEVDQQVSHKGFLPELYLAITRRFTKFSLSVGYDYLNYFVLNDSLATKYLLQPQEVHRVYLRPSYQLAKDYSLMTSLGSIQGAAVGLDFSLSLQMPLSHELGSLTGLAYMSDLRVRSRNESTIGGILSYSYTFF